MFYLTQVALLSKHSPQELVVHSAESWLIEEVPGEGVLLVVYHLLVHCSLPLDSPRGYRLLERGQYLYKLSTLIAI